jgi:phosphonoacetate hydrolase
MPPQEASFISVNGRTYRRPGVPVVAICLDGTGRAYLDAASAVMPNLRAMVAGGAYGEVQSVVPTLTNPNNVAIVTGVPPRANGICGNYYYDAERGAEVMMNDPAYLRCPTILSAFSRAGLSVAVVTTKDKLRRLLGKDLAGVCISIERAEDATVEENGIADVVAMVGRPAPGIYDPEASIYCLETGVRLIERGRIDLLYLSTTDFVQHKNPPGSRDANAFFARVDEFLGRLDRLGVILGATADHGMNDKVNRDGSPQVKFVETILKEAGFAEARVILPITDPYVAHHGALGSYATVYLDKDHVAAAAAALGRVDGIELVLTREQAAERFQLPSDRIGDLVLLSDRSTVLGRTADWHDLSQVKTGLRSHGGLHERAVPLVCNRRLKPEYARRLESGAANNYDLLDFLCNGIEA